MNQTSQIARCLATWFYSGLLKPAPGTWGTLAGMPLGVALLYFGGPLWLAGAFFCLLGPAFWAVRHDQNRTRTQDASEIVVDEVLGVWLAMIPAGTNIPALILAFVLFRFFDILKPWPVGWADKSVDGAWGVLLDDILAGLISAVLIGACVYGFANQRDFAGP